jgi:hypothetical protein
MEKKTETLYYHYVEQWLAAGHDIHWRFEANVLIPMSSMLILD